MPNALNDLESKEWVKRTKSVWASPATLQQFRSMTDAVEYGVLLSSPGPRDKVKMRHPATFSESDIRKLIEFFTRSGDVVLDPFLGSGTTAVVAVALGRKCIGIELYSEWVNVAKSRLGIWAENVTLYQDDAVEALKKLPAEYVDFIVTSPPYWGILNKVDHKAKEERVRRGLPLVYGASSQDYSAIQDYDEFLARLEEVVHELHRTLKRGKYINIIVSDFRHRSRYYLFHADMARILEKCGFLMHGIIVLVQDNKKIYPYGYPSAFVPNICHQFVLVAIKK